MNSKISIGFYAIVGLFILTTTNAISDNNNLTGQSSKILSAQFETRHVVQIESGDFYFKPWQIGPIHTHPAPCVGYIVKGSIIYQVEGEKPVLLKAGDAFYEPNGHRIMRFDNASATTETNFIDFCPEQEGEPFLVFEKKPLEFIDRRALTTASFESPVLLKKVDVSEHLLPATATTLLKRNNATIAGYVVTGDIELKTEGKSTQALTAGNNFYISDSHNNTRLINASSKAKAKVITFTLH